MSAKLKGIEIAELTGLVAELAPIRCAACQDSGWQQVRRADGKLMARRCPQALHLPERLIGLGVPPRYQHFLLASFSPREAAARQAKQLAYRYVKQFNLANGAGLILSGPAGSGKTHLAISIMRLLLSESLAQPRFIDSAELLQQLDGDLNLIEWDRRRQLRDSVTLADLLVLDDLSTLPAGELQPEILEYLLGYRYRQMLPVVITTRLAPEQFQRTIGQNLSSRLSECCQFVTL